MFQNKRYLTRGIHESIPFELQLFLWELIDSMKIEQDYLQVFELTVAKDAKQLLRHTQENPDYEVFYKLNVPNPVNAKIYVIDDINHSTMLLAEEY